MLFCQFYAFLEADFKKLIILSLEEFEPLYRHPPLVEGVIRRVLIRSPQHPSRGGLTAILVACCFSKHV